MDVLTDVLESVRMRGMVTGRVELGAPWGLRMAKAEHAVFHAITRGTCWLEIAGEARRGLSSGDLFVLPHGDAHVLRDSPRTRPVPFEELFAQHSTASEQAARAGGDGATTTLVCGHFEFEDRRGSPLLCALPKVIHIRGEEGRAVPWLEPTLQFVASEAAAGRPGAETVIRRLSDVLFIQIVRAHIASLQNGAGGWLSALGDPQVGAALGLIHDRPERPWTVASLAAEVALSRSAFAARFNALVGEPPLHYVTRWRMQKAASLLRSGHPAARSGLAEIAARVGYESEAAFNKAFKRWFGSAPGANRQSSPTPQKQG